MVKIGRVSYLNTLPLFYSWNSDVFFVDGHPSELAELLRKGDLQAGIVSSVEYLMHEEDYLLVPGVCISSKEKACSVLIFSERPLEELKSIYLTPTSLTSKFLALYVLKKVYKREPSLVEEREKAQALLLIGDEAIKEKLSKRWIYTYDLGEEWYKIHKLPFVFALFLVRKDAPSWLCEYIKEQCERSKLEFYRDLTAGKIEIKEFDKGFILGYFSSCLSYELDHEALRSLYIFNGFLMEKLKLLSKEVVE
ncbi:MAG: menaquinone biosynthesis protein [Aquificaceae bacterium]